MRRSVFYAYMPTRAADGGPFLGAHRPYVFNTKELAERALRRIPGARLFGSIVPVHIVPARRSR